MINDPCKVRCNLWVFEESKTSWQQPASTEAGFLDILAAFTLILPSAGSNFFPTPSLTSATCTYLIESVTRPFLHEPESSGLVGHGTATLCLGAYMLPGHLGFLWLVRRFWRGFLSVSLGSPPTCMIAHHPRAPEPKALVNMLPF